MSSHRGPSQQVTSNPISANTYPRLALHQSHGQNFHMAGDHQEGVHREGVLQPVGNVTVPGEMQYPPHIDAPNYNAAHYHSPPPPAPQVPYVHMYRDDRAAEPVPAQAHPFTPEVHQNYDGYHARFPAADPAEAEAFPNVQPYPSPPTDTPAAANDLRDLAGRLLNNPGTLVNILQIKRGPNGRFHVWIALELADTYIF